MTAMEFPGPGFTSDQWEQIKTLAISMKPGQALWISGYFAGLDHAARWQGAGENYEPLPLADVPGSLTAQQRSLTILYGSETGNSAGLARILRDAAKAKGIEPSLIDMADYKIRRLKDEQDLIIITSTHGEGDPPFSGMSFFEFVEGRKAPKLPNLRYAVLALGDSTYEFFCEAGKRLDRRLAELGATRLQDRVDCDVDYDEPAAAWTASLIEKLTPADTRSDALRSAPPTQSMVTPGSSAGNAIFDSRNPYAATVIDNIVLTGRGSTKETRHVELSLGESGLAFEPGDALGIVPSNDPSRVERLITALSLDPAAAVEVKGSQTTLQEALSRNCEVSAATPRFLTHWSTLSGSDELAALAAEDKAEARTAFFRSHHIIDIVRHFPVPGIDAQSFVTGLRPLQPRLYSIASSLAAIPGEAHLTVSTVRYELHGEARIGVATGHIAGRGQPDEILPVYVKENPHFRLPADDRAIIMVGAGTGVAPYRGFLQQREAAGASGKSWLFFGERHSFTDFLYQAEWQDYLKEGVLTRMNVAFSRDRTQKVYVQDRLVEQSRDIYAWLEDGAHFYICGDGAHLAPDVHAALKRIVRQERNCDEETADAWLAALRQDHRYHIDVY